MFDYILFSGVVSNDFVNDIAYLIEADEKTDSELEDYIKQTYLLTDLHFFETFPELELYVVSNGLKGFYIYSVLLQQIYSCEALADMFQLESSFLSDLKALDNVDSAALNVDFSEFLSNAEPNDTQDGMAFISDTENLDLSYQSNCDITLNIEHSEDEDSDDFSDLFNSLSGDTETEINTATDISMSGSDEDSLDGISTSVEPVANLQFVVSDTIGCEDNEVQVQTTADIDSADSVDFSQYKYYPNMSLSSFLFTNLLDSQPVSAEVLLHYFKADVLERAETAGLITKSVIDGRTNYTLI